ncbi:hypothetical protein C8R45DRAFT_252300 [Mycena sanguinolenta]|nr:hypothetical protein C8R45DRAFT_252300 [Mycena sanguinolenta]
MPDSPTRRLKSMVTGAFRPQRSPSSTSQSVPSAVTNIPSTPSQTPGAAVPSAAIPHSTTFPGTSPSIAPVAVASSASGTPTIGVESTSAETPLVDNLTLALDVTEKLILKTYKEAKDTDDKRDALLAQSTSIGQDLCATILRMEATNHVDLIGRLRPDIEAYTRLLEEASKFVADYDSLKAITRALGRNELGSKFTELQQDLDSFGARFRTNRLVDLAIQQNKMKAIIDEVHAMTLEKKLEEWLRSPPDMRQKQHETQKLRREGTGRWFLEGNKFIEWQDNPGSLWIQGACKLR